MKTTANDLSPGRTAAQLFIWTALGLLVGASIVISILGWIAVGTESGGRCRGDGCPNGSWLHFVAFAFTIVCWLPIVAAQSLVGIRLPSIVALAIALVTGGFAGHALWLDVHGKMYEKAWSASPDRPSTLRSKGAWVTETAVVRTRTDGAIAYDLASGRQRWAYQVPEPQIICTVAETADTVGLLAYGREEAECDQVAAIDLATGKELWKSDLDKVVKSWETGLWGIIAASAGSAVLPAEQGLRGLDLRTGKTLWTWPAPKSCVFDPHLNALTASGTEVATTLQCKSDKSSVAVINSATGTLRWSAPLPTTTRVEEASVVSADPVVVHTKEAGERGKEQLVTFTAEGVERAAFPTSTGKGDLELYRPGYATPAWTLRVQGDVIISAVEGHKEYSFERDLIALDLTGKELWRHAADNGVNGLFTTHDSVYVLSSRGDRVSQLTVLALTTGGVSEQLTLKYQLPNTPTLLFATPTHYALIQSGEDPASFPATVFRR